MIHYCIFFVFKGMLSKGSNHLPSLLLHLNSKCQNTVKNKPSCLSQSISGSAQGAAGALGLLR